MLRATHIAVALLVALAALFLARYDGRKSILTDAPMIPTINWDDVGSLPSAPALLRNSPMQSWWQSNRTVWNVDAITTLATTTDAGEYNVTLQWQQAPCFLLHRGLEDAVMTRPTFDSAVVQLEEAIETLWKFNSTHHHYLAANIEDLPPAIASHILSFLPAGCAYDERSNGGGTGLWPRDVSPEDAHCRGLRSNMWFGAAGTSAETHFDLSHNLFFQSDGSKKFRLLPPSAHHGLQLYPAWHGSHLAAQAKLSDADFTSLGGRSVELRAGDVLYLPPGWFHHVTSRTHNVGLNLWTHSLATDVWHQLHGEAADWDGLAVGVPSCVNAGTATLFRCAINVLQALHGDLASRLSGRVVNDGAARLSAQASALLASRYSTQWIDRVPNFKTEAAGAARASVKQSCERAVQSTSTGLAASQLAVVREYGEALARVDEAGLRALMLDEFVDEFARHIVGPAAATGLGITLGDPAVEVFIGACLL